MPRGRAGVLVAVTVVLGAYDRSAPPGALDARAATCEVNVNDHDQVNVHVDSAGPPAGITSIDLRLRASSAR